MSDRTPDPVTEAHALLAAVPPQLEYIDMVGTVYEAICTVDYGADAGPRKVAEPAEGGPEDAEWNLLAAAPNLLRALLARLEAAEAGLERQCWCLTLWNDENGVDGEWFFTSEQDAIDSAGAVAASAWLGATYSPPIPQVEHPGYYTIAVKPPRTAWHDEHPEMGDPATYYVEVSVQQQTLTIHTAPLTPSALEVRS